MRREARATCNLAFETHHMPQMYIRRPPASVTSQMKPSVCMPTCCVAVGLAKRREILKTLEGDGGAPPSGGSNTFFTKTQGNQVNQSGPASKSGFPHTHIFSFKHTHTLDMSAMVRVAHVVHVNRFEWKLTCLIIGTMHACYMPMNHACVMCHVWRDYSSTYRHQKYRLHKTSWILALWNF